MPQGELDTGHAVTDLRHIQPTPSSSLRSILCFLTGTVPGEMWAEKKPLAVLRTSGNLKEGHGFKKPNKK